MVSLPLVFGVLLAPLAGLGVYGHATRRGLTRRRRGLWAAGVGLATLGSFLLPSLYADPFHRAYLHWVKHAPVVSSPAELLLLHLVVGTALTVAAALLYATASRPPPDRDA